MRTILLLIIIFCFFGCTQSGYKQFYHPYVGVDPLDTLSDIELISENQDPQILKTENLDRDILILRSKKYIPIGFSSFNGVLEDTKYAASQAKKVGASIVLVSSRYTNTQTTSSTLLLPDNKTTYHSGSVYGNTSYSNAYGGYSGSSTTTGSYSGKSTTYGSKAVPITSHHNLYDQTAVYFVKSNKKYKFGIQFHDLSPEDKAILERNTGVLIMVVIEDSPAFYSNVLAGDILIAVDGTTVKNKDHALKLMSSIPSPRNQSILKVIRNGQEKDIRVKF